MPDSPSPWNVPNALSSIRFILAIIVCGLIESQAWIAAMVVFIVAASTDWIDGWWARRYQQVTKLGRILDPFVDKVIICGAMIALVGASHSPVAPWVATLVVARELLVTSLRGMVEGKGGDFSAKQLGKWKMVAQCAAVGGAEEGAPHRASQHFASPFNPPSKPKASVDRSENVGGLVQLLWWASFN